MNNLTQHNSLIKITDFGLGENTFLLVEFSGSEYISDLFHFELTVLSENLDISPHDIVGKTACVVIDDDSQRLFHGHISHFTFGEVVGDDLREYRMTMVPWLWFLTKNNNHRIFQEQNTKEIVTQIFDGLGLHDISFQANGGATREYCVQHNESDFQFISRLLEEEGIAYHFIHEQDKHTLVLTDALNTYEECEQTDLEYSTSSLPGLHLYQWEHHYAIKTGQWTLNDYDFTRPDQNLVISTSSLSTPYTNSSALEHYEYPGFYHSSLGDTLIKIRMEAEEAEHSVVKAASNCASLFAGGKFNLAKHVSKGEKGEYIITGISHSAYDISFLPGRYQEYKKSKHDSGTDTQAENFKAENNSGKSEKTKIRATSEYKNEFMCIPENVQFRPKQKHSRPTMKGAQSAIVVGPEGEEIYTDEYGRIKVQFIWDREGDQNENSSCFLRVMQVWAGNKWGASFIPRIGHEVIVSFLDGDPDRPIVSGSVYNGKNRPPYESKTQSGIKSHSSKGAGASNYNELRFEDKLGEEQVYLQAEKDLQLMVKNNESASVGSNASKSVGANDSLSVGGHHSKNIGGNESIGVAGDRTDTVGGSETISIAASQSESIGTDARVVIGANASTAIGANESTNVAGNSAENVGGKKSVNVGSKSSEMVGSMKSTTVGAAYMLNVGAIMNEIVAGARLSEVGAYSLEAVAGNKTVKIGGDLTISVGGKVTISAGGASIVLEGGNVAIKGGVIDLN